jgi:hypothetical protein
MEPTQQDKLKQARKLSLLASAIGLYLFGSTYGTLQAGHPVAMLFPIVGCCLCVGTVLICRRMSKRAA